MAVYIKSEREIELIRESCHILAKVHSQLAKEVHAGMTTKDIDRIGETIIRDYGCIPSFLDYEGYPASICVSVNDEVVHGIPNDHHYIYDGDIVSLDIGCNWKGYHSDAARTVAVGEISKEVQDLMDRTRQSFFEGVKYAVAGHRLHEISNAIGDYLDQFGYGVVRDLVGHGVGIEVHEDPQIPNFRQRTRGIRLREGMILAIEPMVNLGRADVAWDEDDDWTVLTADGSVSAHYENTVLIRDGEPEILTLTEEEMA